MKLKKSNICVILSMYTRERIRQDDYKEKILQPRKNMSQIEEKKSSKNQKQTKINWTILTLADPLPTFSNTRLKPLKP